MDIRLIFRNHGWGAKGGRSEGGQSREWKNGTKRVGRREEQGKPLQEVEA